MIDRWALAEQYQGALPWPHVVMEDFIQPNVAANMAALFPPPSWKHWKRHRHDKSDKLACGDLEAIGQYSYSVGYLLKWLNSAAVVRLVSTILGKAVQPDLGYFGGGLHLITKGGFLGVHTDFNMHPLRKGWKRAANLLVYLNECDGGNLELWDYRGWQKSVAPKPGRAVLFGTTAYSLHGHPTPLSSKERKSLAVYYYVEATEDEKAHSTVYL